jgi:nucleoside-diphosphate-sugar epimerase
VLDILTKLLDKLLLLGATGFLGRTLLNNLEKKQSIKIMTHNSNFLTNSQKFKGDILKKKSFDKEISNNDTILNLIGQISPNVSDYVNLNIIGALNLLNTCVEKKINRIILISSIHVYGENLRSASKETDSLKPKSQYGLVKMITEQIYQYFSNFYGLDVTILRLGGLYGPEQKTGFITQLFNSVNDSRIHPILYNDGQQFRDLLHVDDAVNGIERAIKTPRKKFEIFNISSGKRYSMNHLVSVIESFTNKKLPITYTPEIIDEKCIWANNLKAQKILNFKPKITLNSGIKSMLNFYSNN